MALTAALPLAAIIGPAILNSIGGILGIADSARKLSGGRVRLARKKRGNRRGTPASLTKSVRGVGLSPMYISRPYVGAGLKSVKKKKSAVRSAVYRRRGTHGRGLLFPTGPRGHGLASFAGGPAKHRFGQGLSPMYISRPYVGSGLGRRRKVKRSRTSLGRGMLTPGNPTIALLKQIAMPSTSFIGKPYLTTVYKGGPQSTKHHIPTPSDIDLQFWPASGGKVTKRILRKRLYARGRGVVADTLGKIPILGNLLAPIVRAFGGKLRKRGGLLSPTGGRGLSPMYISRPYVGSGLKHKPKKKTTHKRGGKIPAYHTRKLLMNRVKGGRHGNLHRMSTTIRKVLSGGALVPRKGHYRIAPSGKRVHVQATVVRHTNGHKGGYLPYTWGPNIVRC